MLKYEELNCVVQNWWWIARNTINWNTWFSFEELVIRQFKYFISFESNSTSDVWKMLTFWECSMGPKSMLHFPPNTLPQKLLLLIYIYCQLLKLILFRISTIKLKLSKNVYLFIELYLTWHLFQIFNAKSHGMLSVTGRFVSR